MEIFFCWIMKEVNYENVGSWINILHELVTKYIHWIWMMLDFILFGFPQ